MTADPLSADQRARARRAFLDLCDAPPAERPARLDALCAGDHALRAHVEAMLRQDPGADAPFIPLVSAGHAAGLAAAITEAPGSMIGPYRILRVLGEGGFGTVFLAEQSAPIRRQVALKVIKLGMDTRQVVARFEQERQAMALLDHPNIAKVFDAGATASGRPYFAMEVCPGEPITRFCDQHRCTIPQRLALAAQASRAVHHAHQRGLIHRDLKPSNILVADVDGTPVPKIIDFGIAKATAPDLRGATLSLQHQPIGTPEYMSPEQAAGEADLDTRTDVYALGVLVFELLTGETPIPPGDLRSAPQAALGRVIHDAATPAPSTRLRAPTSGEVAAARGTDPARLRASLRRELDWVVLKAIDKDRTRRYGSAAELALDLERALAGEAVAAAPPSAWYALRKSARRHRGLVAAAAATFTALALGLAGTLWQAREARGEAAAARTAEARQAALATREIAARAEAERHQAAAEAAARAEAERAREVAAVSEFQGEMLRRLDPYTLGLGLGRDLRDRLGESLRGQDPAAAAMAAADLDRALDLINTSDVAAAIIDRDLLRPSAAAVARRFGDQPAIAGALHATIAAAYDGLSLWDPALQQARRAVALLASARGEDHPDLIRARLMVADTLASLRQAAEAQCELEGLEPVVLTAFPPDDLIRTLFDRVAARVDLLNGRDDAALRRYQARVDSARRTAAPSSEVVLIAISDYAGALVSLRRAEQAEPVCREAFDLAGAMFGPDGPRTLNNGERLVGCLVQLRRFPEASALIDDLLPRRERISGKAHHRTLNLLTQRGVVSVGLRRPRFAESDFREVLGRCGDSPRYVSDRIFAVSRLWPILARRREFDQAEALVIDAALKSTALRRRNCTGMLTRLYTRWHDADPAINPAERLAALERLLAEHPPVPPVGNDTPDPPDDEPPDPE